VQTPHKRKKTRYVIGIDLGTTNSAVSYIDTRKHPFGGFDAITPFQIPQVVTEGQVAKREGLPSFLYLSTGHDLPAGSLDLPWLPDPDVVVGEFARRQGARVPGRLISSAKSWLCHPGVDRKAPILPWGDVGDMDKHSPVDAAAAYLEHMRCAWNYVMAGDDPSQTMENQEVILTVPASFDEVARELTLEAAAKAKLREVILLEEPQAAFYAWLARHGSDWNAAAGPGKTILVCDIGGGTTDFALIRISETESGPVPERIAVGEHLLLGGDNMDLALARLMEQRMVGKAGKSLDSLRWHILTALCRNAKEQMLGGDRDRVPISVPGRGRGVVGGALSAEMTKQDVLETILNGFFPDTGMDDFPAKKAGMGIQEWGLPFAEDPVIPHHLAVFLKRHLGKGENTLPRPDVVFFNGGVFASPVMAERIIDILSLWFSTEAAPWRPSVLENDAPGLAVSQGASYYGMVRRGRGVRIVGGSARSYYVGVAPKDGTPEKGTMQAVCVVAKGMEEGEEVEIDAPDFKVLANQPVSFPFYSSTERSDDQLGQVLTLQEDALAPLPPLRTVLGYGKKGIVRKIPVSLCARLTEVGAIELSCHSRKTEHRWRLQFDIRPTVNKDASKKVKKKKSDKILPRNVLDEALNTIRAAFEAEKLAAQSESVTPATIIKALRRVTGMPKENWPMPVLRRFAEELLKHPDYRTKSPRHEERWLNLMGFCLRPGYGHGGDEFRMQQVFKIYYGGITHGQDTQCQVEWWILWRRIAGGLHKKQQDAVFHDLSSRVFPGQKKDNKKRRISPRERTEMWRALANLERLSAGTKKDMAHHLLKQLGTAKGEGLNMWVLSRLGSRVPLYGPLEAVVPGKTVAAWLERILEMEWTKPDLTGPCAVQMAAFTGDRERDVDSVVRNRLRDRLEALDRDERLIRRLYEPVALSNSEQSWIFGEELPTGLHLAE